MKELDQLWNFLLDFQYPPPEIRLAQSAITDVAVADVDGRTPCIPYRESQHVRWGDCEEPVQ